MNKRIRVNRQVTESAEVLAARLQGHSKGYSEGMAEGESRIQPARRTVVSMVVCRDTERKFITVKIRVYKVEVSSQGVSDELKTIVQSIVTVSVPEHPETPYNDLMCLVLAVVKALPLWVDVSEVLFSILKETKASEAFITLGEHDMLAIYLYLLSELGIVGAEREYYMDSLSNEEVDRNG